MRGAALTRSPRAAGGAQDPDRGPRCCAQAPAPRGSSSAPAAPRRIPRTRDRVPRSRYSANSSGVTKRSTSKMIGRRPQILSQREEIDRRRAQILHRGANLRVRLAEAEHQAGLGQHRRPIGSSRRRAHRGSAGSRRADRAPDASGARRSRRSAQTHRAPSPARCPHPRDTPAKSGVSASTAVCGVRALDGADGRRIVRRAAVRQVVAVDRGEHDVVQAHQLDRAGDVLGLLGIEPAARIAGIDRAEAASARAHRPHQHDGGGAGVPAFADVRALGLLADGAQTVLAHDVLDGLEARAARQRRPQPGRLASGRRGRLAADLMPSLMAVKPCGVGISRRCAPARRARWAIARAQNGDALELRHPVILPHPARSSAASRSRRADILPQARRTARPSSGRPPSSAAAAASRETPRRRSPRRIAAGRRRCRRRCTARGALGTARPCSRPKSPCGCCGGFGTSTRCASLRLERSAAPTG